MPDQQSVLDDNLIKQIFNQLNLGVVKFVQKLNVGFSNDVYSVDDKYILKVCKSTEDEINLGKEVYLCKLFKDIVPAPKVIAFDTSKKFLDRHFIIYQKIAGENLYTQWHLYDDTQRKNIIKQICGMLKEINSISYVDFAQKFNIDVNVGWEDNINNRINDWLDKIAEKQILSLDVMYKIRQYLNKNKDVLKEQEMALTYWDVHFDNFLVHDAKIVGMLDFERTEIASIDYALDIIRRTVSFPKKYASEESEKYIVDDDYKNLMEWYKDYYPELFDFKNLDKRLDIYSIERRLGDIYYYPEATEPRQDLEKLINYQKEIYVDPRHTEHAFDLPFWRDNEKLWALKVPAEEMNINELLWILDIPFWEDADGNIVITPNEVMADPKKYQMHWDKIQSANTSFPIDIMKNKNGKWLTLDGLHRLVKIVINGGKTIQVRKIPPELIHLTAKEE